MQLTLGISPCVCLCSPGTALPFSSTLLNIELVAVCRVRCTVYTGVRLAAYCQCTLVFTLESTRVEIFCAQEFCPSQCGCEFFLSGSVQVLTSVVHVLFN